MFLSIIIPCYNAVRYLGECLDSCLNQDFENKEYEIICIDDGSIDNSADVIRSYQNRYNNIILIQQEQSGVSCARNRGIEKAQGDYIWFIDADDFVDSRAFKILYKKKCTGNFDKISFAHYEVENHFSTDELNLVEKGLIKPNTTPAGWNIWESIFSREFILKHNIRFRKGISYGEDALFCYEFGYHSPESVSIENVLYFYRRNDSSQTRKKTVEANIARQTSSYLIAKIKCDYARMEQERTVSASRTEKTAVLMPLVRGITISAASLPVEKRREIIGNLKTCRLYPLFLYKHFIDKFPKRIHMSHSYMGLKGRILDILNFYSTTRVGFHLLVLFNKLKNKLQR